MTGMKKEEAVKELKVMISEQENLIKYNKDIYPKMDNHTFETKVAALKIAVESLENEDELSDDKAKEVDARHCKEYDGYNDGYCPICGAYIQENDYDTFFCVQCGEKLKWTEQK